MAGKGKGNGISGLIAQGSIFDPLRQHGPELWRDLVKCPLCSGVWVGGLAAVLCLDLYALPLRYAPFLVLGLGSLSGCAALLFVRVWDALESFAALLELEAEGRKRWEELQSQYWKPRAAVDVHSTQQDSVQSRSTSEDP